MRRITRTRDDLLGRRHGELRPHGAVFDGRWTLRLAGGDARDHADVGVRPADHDGQAAIELATGIRRERPFGQVPPWLSRGDAEDTQRHPAGRALRQVASPEPDQESRHSDERLPDDGELRALLRPWNVHADATGCIAARVTRAGLVATHARAPRSSKSPAGSERFTVCSISPEPSGPNAPKLASGWFRAILPMRSPLIARAVSRAPNAGKAARRKPAAPLASFPIGRNLGMTAQVPLRPRRAESTGSANLLHRGYKPRIRVAGRSLNVR